MCRIDRLCKFSTTTYLLPHYKPLYILTTYTSIRRVIIDMSIKAKAVEKGEDFLERMKLNHPTAYAMADKMVNPKMNEDATVDIKTFVMLCVTLCLCVERNEALRPTAALRCELPRLQRRQTARNFS